MGISVTLAGKEISCRPAADHVAAGGEGSEHKAGKFARGGRMEVLKKHEAVLRLSTALLDHVLH